MARRALPEGSPFPGGPRTGAAGERRSSPVAWLGPARPASPLGPPARRAVPPPAAAVVRCGPGRGAPDGARPCPRRRRGCGARSSSPGGGGCGSGSAVPPGALPGPGLGGFATWSLGRGCLSTCGPAPPLPAGTRRSPPCEGPLLRRPRAPDPAHLRDPPRPFPAPRTGSFQGTARRGFPCAGSEGSACQGRAPPGAAGHSWSSSVFIAVTFLMCQLVPVCCSALNGLLVPSETGKRGKIASGGLKGPDLRAPAESAPVLLPVGSHRTRGIPSHRIPLLTPGA